MKCRKPLFGCTFGILGDSYATFRGFVTEGHPCYYPNPEKVTDVLQVEDTWWHQLMQRNNMQMLVNDSYSGATVCTTVRDKQPLSSAFTERAKCSFSGEIQPDYIFVLGGTNDSWLERPIGQVMFCKRTEEDLKQMLPAYCEVIEYVIAHNPHATVVAVLNTGLHPDIHAGILRAAEHYGVIPVALREIDKQNGHPSALGMRQIADQVQHVLDSI